MNQVALTTLPEREFVRQWNSLLEEIHTAPDFAGGRDFGIDFPTLNAVRPDLAERLTAYKKEAQRRLKPETRVTTLCERIAGGIAARSYGLTHNRQDVVDVRTEEVEKLVRDYMPSGSGIDNGVKIDLDKCNDNRLTFTFGYHHMNESGMYCGWTDHSLIVTPSFDGIRLKITGRDRNFVKEYLYDLFHHALTQPVA